jgi:hypothetical protein
VSADRAVVSRATATLAVAVAALTLASATASAAATTSARPDPCALVATRQVQSITGKRVSGRVEAPLGPTCIYRFQKSKQLVTITVGPAKFAALVAQISKRQRRRVSIRGHIGFCGRLGQPVLYVSLSQKRVLTIGAGCTVARQLATIAVRRL